MKETLNTDETIVCTKTSVYGGKSFVCTGFTTKPVGGIPKVDFIHMCFYNFEELKKVEEGVCPVRAMVSITPQEAINLGLNLIRTVTLFEVEKDQEENENK